MCTEHIKMCILKAYPWNGKTLRGAVWAQSPSSVWWSPRQQYNIRVISTYAPTQTLRRPLQWFVPSFFQTLLILQTNYNIFQQSVTQWSRSINNKRRKQKEKHTWNSGSNSVSKFILMARFGTISVIASTLKCFKYALRRPWGQSLRTLVKRKIRKLPCNVFVVEANFSFSKVFILTPINYLFNTHQNLRPKSPLITE